MTSSLLSSKTQSSRRRTVRESSPADIEGAVGTAQEIGGVPDDIALVFESVEVFHERNLGGHVTGSRGHEPGLWRPVA